MSLITGNFEVETGDVKPHRPRILSALQPTSPKLHLGNLIGALLPLVNLQEEYNVFCGIADLHALTTMYEHPEEISKNVRQVTMDYIAAGLDPERSVIFQQSHVPEHSELHLLFSMITPLGWLERIPTYKEKRELFKTEREPYGLMGYPVLQTADILLYKPYGVPVGKDQAAHLEIAREIARRFNNLYRPVFPEFKSLIGDVPTLLGTDGRKMSKSYHNCIYISDSEDETAHKIKTAYTDPLKIHKHDPGHPDGCSVFSLHTAFNKANVATVEIECRTGARGCMHCKKECILAVNESLREIRERRKLLDVEMADAILEEGAKKAREVAGHTLAEAKEAMQLY